MKKRLVLLLVIVLTISTFVFVSGTANPRLNVNERFSDPSSSGESFPLPSNFLGGIEVNAGELKSEKDDAISRNLTENVSPSLPESHDNSETSNLSNDNFTQTEVPVPNGRVFLHREAPYGYSPTVSPKENVTVPLLPFDFEG